MNKIGIAIKFCKWHVIMRSPSNIIMWCHWIILNTSFSNKTQYPRNFFGFFYFTRLDPDIGHLGLGRTRSNHEQWRGSPLQKTKEKGKRRTMVGSGNGGGQWWADGAALHCALFLFFFFEQWRMQKTKEKEKGKGNSSGWR